MNQHNFQVTNRVAKLFGRKIVTHVVSDTSLHFYHWIEISVPGDDHVVAKSDPVLYGAMAVLIDEGQMFIACCGDHGELPIEEPLMITRGS